LSARRVSRSGWVAALMLALLGTAGVRPALAQTPQTAALTGRITDAHGEGLPGVLVTLTNPSTPVGGPTVVTDIEGRYSLSLLPPGTGYVLKASIPGYATVIAEGIELVAGRTTALNLTLQTSSESSETIRVEGRGEIVDTSSSATATQYNAEFIEGAPLVGRRFSDLLTLAPGVTDTDGDGNPNVRGARDTGLQLRLDGSNATNPLTGKAGQDINLETVQDVEVITAGAPAEYGRTDGGFANVITKSGGNEFEGSLKVFYRSDFLDGSGGSASGAAPDFSDTDTYLTAGGPIVRDHLWYFASAERLDEEVPVVFSNGAFGQTSREGWRAFGKITWQASPDHKLSFQINYDPLELKGNNIGPVIDPETDYTLRTGGPLPQLTWTAILSPSLLLQTVGSYLDLDQEIDPSSGQFREFEIDRVVLANGQTHIALPCLSRNCVNEPGLRRFFRPPGSGLQQRQGPLMEEGPYSVRSAQKVKRFTFRSDLSYTVEGGAGSHGIKSGFESSLERYDEDVVNNPVLTDNTCEGFHCPNQPPPPPGLRLGNLDFQIYDPVRSTLSAESFNAGAYLQDAWKPWSHLTLSLGARYDYSAVQTEGVTSFDPRSEAREVMRRYNLICDAAGSSCTGSRTPGLRNGRLPAAVTPPPGHPALKFDLNGDGVVELTGVEGAQFLAPFTTQSRLAPDQFLITNGDLSPRLSFAWDPWADGKTKVFGTWGVYRDRLFLQSVATEQQPRAFTATWFNSSVNDQAEPGELSSPLPLGVSIGQTGRDLSTPYTIESTVGFERELAPEWAVSLSWISRRAKDLLQDLDVNHITCKGFDEQYHVRPMDVCGDGGRLELDRFGTFVPSAFGGFLRAPNGAIDLYNLNPNFNQVLRVGNFNSSDYHAVELVLHKRLHHNWQMQAGYTWSRAEGDAESFTSLVGNDPAVSDKQRGFLDYDQRHILKWQAVVHLKGDLLVGGTVEWASGLPFTFVSNVEDRDDTDVITPQRVFSVTGTRNDQRNRSQLTVNGRVEKRLNVGKMSLSAFLEAENILNSDDLVLQEIDQESRSSIDGYRRFGRRWQIGAALYF